MKKLQLMKKVFTFAITGSILFGIGVGVYRSYENGLIKEIVEKGLGRVASEEIKRQKDMKLSSVTRTAEAVSVNLDEPLINTFNAKAGLTERWLREGNFLVREGYNVQEKKFEKLKKMPPLGSMLSVYEYYYTESDVNHYEGNRINTSTQLSALRANVNAVEHDVANKKAYIDNAVLLADRIISDTFKVNVYDREILCVAPSLQYFEDTASWEVNKSQIYAQHIFETAELFAELSSITGNEKYKNTAAELLSGQMFIQDTMPQNLLPYGIAYEKEMKKNVVVHVFPLSVYRYAYQAYSEMFEITKDTSYQSRLDMCKESFDKALTQCTTDNALWNALRPNGETTLQTVNFNSLTEEFDIKNDFDSKMVLDTVIANYYFNEEVISNMVYDKVQQKAKTISEYLFLGGYTKAKAENLDLTLFVQNSEADIVLGKDKSDKVKEDVSHLLNSERITKDRNGIGASSRIQEKPVIDAEITCAIYNAIVK